MAKTTLTYLSYFFIIFIISRLIPIIGVNQRLWTDLLPPNLLSLDISSRLSLDQSSLAMASTDFGNLVHTNPAAVLHPSSVDDIVSLLKFSYNNSFPFKVAARGRGHSCRGQAMVENGVVIDMPSLSIPTRNNFDRNYDKNNNYYHNDRIRVSHDPLLGFYADIGGEQLWVDVLHATLDHGVAPVSWTDYLYLSVGGTLSNAGISGQTFRYGPQINNVHELDVVTGKGELITCSKKMNSELFHAVLGGLGQFGIITRARIRLEAAPKRVKWVRMLYDDFSTFTRDQEHLISLYGNYQELININHGLNYVEGSIILQQSDPNNWRSSFFSSNDQARITSLNVPNGVLYFLEVAKFYYDHDDDTNTDKELKKQLEGLNYIPECIFTRDVSFVEFLNRVRKGELELHSKGLWEVPHPWLNIFIPKSQIEDLHHVIPNIIAKDNTDLAGPILFYPLNRNKWDDKMSAVTPEEDVFYTLGLLHSSGFDDWEALERKNEEILKYCEEHGIKIKQYLPHYTTKKEWESHFGHKKWRIFQQRKNSFDPKMILSPGQKIFNSVGQGEDRSRSM
ncbi:cytokinin dehydrogenase 3-like [Chenopodium quinoa]|uniref:cytokinin dehydrogenase 3-like n=1 Tax=Chenopodium quinoa TaxID=63459 RepID=UPI000B796667|nr:cytokinin dehydrogenase 3-like [Chenopodium quinoa]